MPREFFEALADALAGFLPSELRGFSSRAGSRNLKVWYGDETREHYEAQIISPGALPARTRPKTPVLEIGFHAEHAGAQRNDAALAAVAAGARRLGTAAVAGPFLGTRVPGTWRRLSETWPDARELPAEAAIEAAERLARYIRALEPARRKPRR